MIRICTSSLLNLRLQHCQSVLDEPKLQGRTLYVITGSTLWASTPDTHRIEVRWRWAELSAAIVMLEPQHIETNLDLLTPTGTSEPRYRALIHLVEYVETLPWRAPILQLLLRFRH